MLRLHGEIRVPGATGCIGLTKPPLPWFRFAASFLPGLLHGDAADRILVTMAREHDLTIITRDRAILAYGAAGHVKVLAC